MREFLLMQGPFTSRSGYGDHARDLFKSFWDLDRFDIKIVDTRWGDCPRNALKVDNETHQNIFNCKRIIILILIFHFLHQNCSTA